MIDLSKRYFDQKSHCTQKDDAEHRKRAKAAAGTARLFSGMTGRPACPPSNFLAGGLPTIKADDRDPAREERQRRLDAMLPAVRARAGTMPDDALGMLDFVAKASKAAGGEPVSITRTDAAKAIGTSPGLIDALLEHLVDSGLVRRSRGSFGTERFLPLL